MREKKRRKPPTAKGKTSSSPQKREPEEKQGVQQSTTESFPIVCLGASAGGLKSLEEFLSNTTDKGDMAFVVISHTDPDRASLLPVILQRKSKMQVRTVEEGMIPERNTVYLPPSNKDLLIQNGIFHLQDREQIGRLHLPIDLFLESLAKNCEEFAGCIILSGTGSDGTHGLRLIKEAGGIGIAESRTSASHYGMPQSAIETGMVDFILEPAQMPRQLIEYFERHFLLKDTAEAATGGLEEVKEIPKPLNSIIRLLASRTKHDFSHYKKSTLIRRIERRINVTHSQNAARYLDYLRRNADESGALFQELLIGVTEFFRDPEIFNLLSEKVLPDLFARREEGESLRIWVAGCATGEEVYSVAIVVSEYMRAHKITCGLQIFGTDIDPKAIEKARQGIYLQNIANKVGAERLERFFTKKGDHYQVKKELREPVVFAIQDILRDPPFTKLDLLFCRNLLIYLESAAQDRVISFLHYSLKTEGVLFLGPSETVGRFSRFFNTLDRKYGMYSKKDLPVTDRPILEFPRVEMRLGSGIMYTQPVGYAKEQAAPGIAQAAEKFLLKELTPSCVLVNQGGHILYVHGRTGKFLELVTGRPDLEVSSMARGGLRFPLSSALRRASVSKKQIHQRGLRVKTNGGFLKIDLTVTPLTEPGLLKDTLMIVFEESSASPEKAVKELPEEKADLIEPRTAELEQELLRVREDHRSALEELETSNEELKSVNEEMYSANEELASTNEELNSSREELQSLNEELNTVNNELQSKIEALTEAYASITDVLNSTKIAILFLDNDLFIKRFTPEAAILMNLIDTDVGRPIAHISHNLQIEDLPHKIRQVVITLAAVDENVQTVDGHWYQMRCMVHRTNRNVIEGAVLTFINIDAQKKAQGEVERIDKRAVGAAKKFSDCIVDTARESFLVLNKGYCVLSANRSFCQTFQVAEKEVKGKSLFELQDHQWDIPSLRTLLKEIKKENKASDDFKIERRFPNVGQKHLLLNARLLVEDDEKSGRILFAIKDITGRNIPQEKGK